MLYKYRSSPLCDVSTVSHPTSQAGKLRHGVARGLAQGPPAELGRDQEVWPQSPSPEPLRGAALQHKGGREAVRTACSPSVILMVADTR